MINKPIAWMSPDGKVSQTEGKLFHIPLYTLPKPLSDEEITYQFQYKCPRFSRLDIFKYAVRWAEERHGIK